MKNNISMGMGGTLVIVIFVVLCLTIFATLSFTTAYSDLKLVNKTQEMSSDYYTTEGNAEKKLSGIFDAMVEATPGDPDDYYHRLSSLLSQASDVKIISSDKNDFKIYYEVLGEKNQKICVTLRISNDETNIPEYEIVTWNLANIELPVYEEKFIDLWEGIE